VTLRSRRHWPLTGVLVALALLFAACGDADDSGDAAEAAEQPTETSAAPTTTTETSGAATFR
jgi:hypothetical protein